MLDAGAQALIVPCVETVEQVKQLVQYAKFAPLGNRGFCPTRDGGWGFAPHASGSIAYYMETCNRETLLIPQCETLGARKPQTNILRMGLTALLLAWIQPYISTHIVTL
jgi:4-hydroxy-2-oxoheptanedioate aldolase